MKHFRTKFLIPSLAAILSSSVFVFGQSATPDQHSQHHPQPGEATPSPEVKMTAPKTGGGMTGGMGEMMDQMGKTPPKELYPSLIELPDLSPENRAELERLAQVRIDQGNALINEASEKLSNPVTGQNAAALQEASAQMRQGLTQLESGLATQRAIAESQNTQGAAFKWFKQTMNLAPAIEAEQTHGFFGLTWFHYITMISLAAFAASVIWIYLRKMKRADALVKRLAGGQPLVENAKSHPVDAVGSLDAAVNPQIAPTRSNSWTGTLRVAQIFQETSLVKTFRLVEPAGGKLPFSYLPGQFITITIAPKGLPIKRSYTIASSPTRRDSCEISVKREEQGTVSAYLHDHVHEGEILQLTGPSGQFTFTGEESDSVVLIAGGVGVTPMMSVIRYLTDRSWHGEIFFIYGCRSESQVIFREEIEYIQKRHPNLHVNIILEEPGDNANSLFLTGLITKDVLSESVPAIASRNVHICGPSPMMAAVKEMLVGLEVPTENIKTEIFAGKLPRTKVSPAAIGESVPSAVVSFARSNKTAMLTPEKTILEGSEDVGVKIDFSCRIGTCGICKTKLLSGAVTMDIEDALTPEDKANNIVLACQARATGDVAVDA